MPLTRIFDKPVKSGEHDGRPVYTDVPYLEIITPGALDEVWQRKLTDTDKATYAEAWAKYQAGKGAEISGWRIEEWAALTPGEVETLKGMKFFTVELLAEASDSHVQFMGGTSLRERARAAIATAADQGATDRLVQKVEDQNAEIQRLNEQIESLSDQLRVLAPKRGRPRKELVD